MKYLVTGNAGFIGSHVVIKLLERGHDVVGFDNLNDYYDPQLKEARLQLQTHAAESSEGTYIFVCADIADLDAVNTCFSEQRPDRVINLAAQPGVRYSLENPHAYVQSNIVGFTNLLEACRHHDVKHLVYASTSSVYGANSKMPFSEHHGVDHPVQFYAATKRANELMAHSYSHLFGLPTTGLRFFTVYGPWGRPDMAPFLFTRNIIEGTPIKVFNHGKHSRDFTHVNDIAEGVVRISEKTAEPNADWNSENPDPASSKAPYRIYNIGNSEPVDLIVFIKAIEDAVGKRAILEMLPLQPGDVPDTFADTSDLAAAVDYRPSTPITDGVAEFVDWYRNYYSAS